MAAPAAPAATAAQPPIGVDTRPRVVDPKMTLDHVLDSDNERETWDEKVGVKCVLLDIEGTICPISFVKDVLFPYALEVLPDVLAAKWDDKAFKPYRDAFPEDPRSSPETLHAYVERLTEADRKDACLKNLQGYLWETGYKTGAYATPLFPDVAPRLKEWKDAGLTLAIYSSGSVFAQKLLFGHAQVCDRVPGGEELQDWEEQFVSATGFRDHLTSTNPGSGEKRTIEETSALDSAAGANEERPTNGSGKKRAIDETAPLDAAEAADDGPPAKKVAVDGETERAGSETARQAANEEPPTEKLASKAEGKRAVRDVATSEAAPASPPEAKSAEMPEIEDLQYLITDWFDTTNAGNKKEPSSYHKIAKELNFFEEEILFLTDSVVEYDAASTAGLRCGLMMRPGNPKVHRYDNPNRLKMMWSLNNAHPLRSNYGMRIRFNGEVTGA